MNDAPAERARQLLAWWTDPADADLLAGWLEKQRGFRPVTPALAPLFLSAPEGHGHVAQGSIPGFGRPVAHLSVYPRVETLGYTLY